MSYRRGSNVGKFVTAQVARCTHFHLEISYVEGERLHGLKCYADAITPGMKGLPEMAALRSWKIDRPCLRTVEI